MLTNNWNNNFLESFKLPSSKVHKIYISSLWLTIKHIGTDDFLMTYENENHAVQQCEKSWEHIEVMKKVITNHNN